MTSKEMISGPDLKKVREATGMKIEELYELTRIGQAKIKAIEENIFSELPPEVYLKNFLKLYAEIFHLDPEKVVKGYLKHMAANAQPPSSGKPSIL
jgi:cytoskeletal protein RodZ